MEQLSLGQRWLADGRRVVLASLIDAQGSSPFEPGAFMLVDASSAIEGSITGGCVESDIVENARAILHSVGAPRLLQYGVSDAFAQAAGLMCGGEVKVLVHELRGAARNVCREAFEAATYGEPVGIATLVDGDRAGAKLAVIGDRVLSGFDGPELLDHSVAHDLMALFDRGTNALRHYGRSREALGCELTVHLQTFHAPPRLLLVGAIDYSAAVAALAAQAGYKVTIVDAREDFVRADRFVRVASIRVGWPAPVIDELELGPHDAIVIFSHDPKFDEPAILAALRSDAGYIGALGSRRTAADRQSRLIALGVDRAELGRVHSPCGLDIGAATPEEVAISIIAEVIAARSGRPGARLVAGEGPIRPR
jgi:xanthine dehydrogenase accessory factor